jgi:hypothetical protein
MADSLFSSPQRTEVVSVEPEDEIGAGVDDHQ